MGRGRSPGSTAIRDTFEGEYVTEVEVYLDTEWAANNGFDYSVASNGSDGDGQRDFIFHVSNADGDLRVGASNNSSTNNFSPKTGLDPDDTIDVTGWYTLQHRFYDNGGLLAVDMRVFDPNGDVVFETTLGNNPADTIPGEVGGNRYGWFVGVNVDGGLAVNSQSLAPVIRELEDGVADENSATLTRSDIIPFTDVDQFDTHTPTAVFTSGGTELGTLTFQTITNTTDDDLAGEVPWTYEISAGALDSLGQDESLTQTYAVTLTDQDNLTDTRDLVITLFGENDAPEPVADTGITDEDTVLSVSDPAAGVLGNDVDVDANDMLVVTEVANGATTVAAGAQIAGSDGGLFTINADGTYAFDPNEDFEDLAQGVPATTSVTYTVSDGLTTATETLTVTVTGVNDAPVAEQDRAQPFPIVDEDEQFSRHAREWQGLQSHSACVRGDDVDSTLDAGSFQLRQRDGCATIGMGRPMSLISLRDRHSPTMPMDRCV